MAVRQTNRLAKSTQILIIALFMIIGVAGQACAGGSLPPSDESVGNWIGSFKYQKDGQEKLGEVTLEVNAGEAYVHFGPNRSCGANAKQVSTEGSVQTYNFYVKHGESLQGWCKTYRDENMTLTRIDGQALSMHVPLPEGGAGETLRLTKK